VDLSDYFYEPVMWAINQNPVVTSGIDETHFGPHNDCTREQIVTFLWAANGKPDPEGTESPFSDVASDAWYYKPVMWAVENGYTSGMGDGSFGVGQACTRAQAMTFLWAAQGKPEPSSTVSPFSDVAIGDWFCKPILWAAENGVTAGIGGGLFGVNNTCTRAQIITFLYKAYT
ncbi:MAG: S-layer homology domain-containing protein, partial [Oscillospiraceae bacterium]|nr:S-layer homology domain-containing protein [Oscillospiraceae bacterium]